MERTKVSMDKKILPRVEDYEEDSSSSSMPMCKLDSKGGD
jgi:hypothetical protein